MSPALIRTLTLCVSVALTACSHTSQTLRLNAVDIGTSAELILPARSEMQSSLDATQLISGVFDGNDYTMQVQVEWRPGSMAVVALGVWGTAVFSLTYDGSEMQIRGNTRLLQGLKAEHVLADLLLTVWESSQLKTNLRGNDLRVVDTPLRRTIEQEGAVLIAISYENASPWSGSVRFEHIERGYVLEIETLQYR